MRNHFFAAALVISCSEPRADSDDTAVPAPTLRVPTATASAGACEQTRFDGSGVGALRIGTSVADLERVCSVVRDTTVMGAEGMPARLLWVRIGPDSVAAEIVDDKVWRIALRSPSFQTQDSIRVGTSLARLLPLQGARGMMGEGALYVTASAHCGVSFRLSQNQPYDPSGNWLAAALRKLPPSTSISEILIFGCARGPGG